MATAATVRTLLRLACRVQDYQLLGAPAWFSTKRFDIAAKVEDSPPPSLQILLQTLLKDRFGLAIHNETYLRNLAGHRIAPRELMPERCRSGPSR